MKKYICAIVAILLVSLNACGGDSGGILPPTDQVIQSDQPAKQVTVEPGVLLEEKGLKIQLKNLDAGGLFGPELKLLIENDSEKNLTIQCRHASVNGYMVETMFSADVAAGKKSNDGITFLSADLERSGITEIADMEFSFHVFTTEDWDTYLDSKQIRVETSLAQGYGYTYDHPGTVAYEGEEVKIVVKGLAEQDSLLGPELIVYLHNTGSKSVTVQCRETSVNGFMVEAMFSQEVMPGKHAVSGITFADSDLEENAIEKLEEAELSFHIFDTESWKTIKDTEPVTVKFQ